MPQIDIPPDEFDRLEELSAALADEYAGEYASVTNTDAIVFLLDLAASIENPYRMPRDTGSDPVDDRGTTALQSPERSDTADPDEGFPRDHLESTLHERNRKGGDTDQMDLYTIAAEYDVTGRSDMTKDELIDAILAETRERYTNPLAPVDIPFPNERDGSATDTDVKPSTRSDQAASSTVDDDSDGSIDHADDAATDDSEAGSDDAQLDAMLHLLDTHDDVWGHSDGDARYEVELPDGSYEPARTKDDVRALLFKHY